MKKKKLLKPAGEAKQKPKTRPPTEIERQMGQIVVDFANAETTDAACFKHFENMQDFMAFSPNFVERAKEKFLAFHPLYSFLTKTERELLYLIKQEKQTKDSINKDLKDKELGCMIERHDAETSILRVWTLDPHSELHNSLVSAGFSIKRGDRRFEMTVDEFKDEIKDSVGGILQGRFLSDLDEFIEIRKKISILKAQVSSSRLKELMQLFDEYSEKYPLRRMTHSGELISELSERYFDVGSLHAQLERLQEALRVTLSDIIDGRANCKHYYLEIFLEKYNDLPKSKIEFSDTGLMEVPPLNEKEYVDIPYWGFIEKRTKKGTTAIETGWLERFEDDLAYCLIEFLKSEGNKNYIYRCNNCKDFYLPKKIYSTNSGLYFCSAPCRYSFHHSKPEYKEKKAAAQREKYGWEPKVHAK